MYLQYQRTQVDAFTNSPLVISHAPQNKRKS